MHFSPRLPAILLFASSTSALTFDCNHIRADEVSFDLSPLGGPKEVHEAHKTGPDITANTTFTLDICANVDRPAYIPKGEDFCSPGTRVCAVQRIQNPQGTSESAVIEIAGEYASRTGRGLEPKFTRLKDSKSHSDSTKEGVRVELNGGKSADGQKQSAIIEFLCDKELTGNEGFEDAKVKREENGSEDEGDNEGDNDDTPNPDKGKSLEFVSYQMEHDIETLRLLWKTKYACEDAINEPKTPKKSASGSWGFFTWMIIIVFLLAAAYIIFGSWLNYNRYGARGWDLIPHGDTIRDLPYIVKDWSSNVMDKVRGQGGSREEYSAV